MIEKLGAGAEKLFPRLHPANGMFEFWDVSLGDVDQVFLHLLDMLGLDKVRDFPGRFLVKQLDVCLYHFSGDDGDWFVEKGGVELRKDPGMADSSATDHEPGGLGLLEISEAGGEVDDIAIGDHWTVEGSNGLCNAIIVNWRLITFLHGSPMDREKVDCVAFEDSKKLIKFFF